MFISSFFTLSLILFSVRQQILLIDRKLTLDIMVSGDSVAVEDEVVVTSSIVLPNKTLNVSVQDEIIL